MRRLQLQQQLFIVLLLLMFFPGLLTSSAQNNWRRKRVLNIKVEELFLLPGERGRRIRNGRKLRAGRQPSPRTGSCSWDTAASHVTNSSWRKGRSTVPGRESNQGQADVIGLKQPCMMTNSSGVTKVQSLFIGRRQPSPWKGISSWDTVEVTWPLATGKEQYGHLSYTVYSPTLAVQSIVISRRQLSPWTADR